MYFFFPHPRVVVDKINLILETMKSYGHMELFYSPVDPEKAVGYTDLIKHPMDFLKIENKLTCGEYSFVMGNHIFSNDVRLVFDNCRLYNEPTSSIYILAKKLFFAFELLYAKTFGYEIVKKRGRPILIEKLIQFPPNSEPASASVSASSNSNEDAGGKSSISPDKLPAVSDNNPLSVKKEKEQPDEDTDDDIQSKVNFIIYYFLLHFYQSKLIYLFIYLFSSSFISY